MISSQQNRQELFKKKKHTKISVLFALFLLIGLMIADQRYSYVDNLRASLSYVLSPIQYAVDWPVRMIAWIEGNITSHKELVSENMQLRYKQMMLQAQLQKLLAIKNENRELRKLLNTAEKDQAKVVAAQILAVATNDYQQIVILNKGSRDKLYVGQPVLDAYGLMGQVIAVNPVTSTVLLVSDIKSGIPVQNSRTGERSIVVGGGTVNSLELIHMPNTSETKEGDLLLTSGLAGRFPEGYPVGKVVDVKAKASEPFMQVSVRPIAKLNRSRLVLLSWPSAKEKRLSEIIAKANT